MVGLCFLAHSACAYKFGLSQRLLPGGYTQVAIPIFKNKSAEVGIEPLFTNALIRRFERSQVARVTEKDLSPVAIEGTILRVETVAGAAIDRNQLSTLPQDAVMTTDYRIVTVAAITLRRKSDEKIIWEGQFSNEKGYSSARIGTAVVNSANATYNQSARIQAISLLAEEMMLEAHDRITENY